MTAAHKLRLTLVILTIVGGFIVICKGYDVINDIQERLLAAPVVTR